LDPADLVVWGRPSDTSLTTTGGRYTP